MVARKVTKRTSKKPGTRLRTVSLKWVYDTAKKDPKFLDAFLKDPVGAAAKKGVALSESALQTIEETVAKVYEIKGMDLARLVMPPGAPVIPWPSYHKPSKYKPWP